MNDPAEKKLQETTPLLMAADYAARQHVDQRRKGEGREPYVNHVIEVAYLLAQAGYADDEELLLAALLHDTVEDTSTSLEDIRTMFGTSVAALVEEVTDDMSLPKQARKQAQIDHAPHLSRRAKLLKIADKTSNLRDIAHSPPKDWPVERLNDYIDWAEQVIAHCRGLNDFLEKQYEDAVAAARARWSD